MKQITTLTLILLTLTTQAQLSISAGPNVSWFAKVDKVSAGSQYAKTGAKVGISYNTSNRPVSLNTGLYFINLGAYNHNERTRFVTSNLMLPVSMSLHFGDLSFQLGGYLNRTIGAKNTVNGEAMDWAVRRWSFWRLTTVGLTSGIAINLNPVTLQLSGIYGLSNVRRPYRGEMNLWNNRDRAVSLSLVIPFKTFAQ